MDKKIINKIAWWIPIKKWRDNFRNAFNPIYDRNSIQQIDIEVFSYCNRQCWFCPNSILDRHSQNQYMDENLYLKILNELKEFNITGFISYSRYNEPLADKIILKRIKQAREILPNVRLTFNTNGDYLSKEYLDELAESGLNDIQIQCYLNQNEQFDIENTIKPKMMKLINKLVFLI